MAKEIVALNGGMGNRMMEGRIRRKFKNNGGRSFFFLDFVFKR
jgi:hypothetical protein